MYFMPAALAIATHCVGVELGRIELLVEVVVLVDRGLAPRDQLISVPLRLTGPQWMNMPKRMSCQRWIASGLAGCQAGVFAASFAVDLSAGLSAAWADTARAVQRTAEETRIPQNRFGMEVSFR